MRGVGGRQADWKREGFEAGFGVAGGVVSHAVHRRLRQRPGFVDARTQQAEGGVVGTGYNKQPGIG